MTQQPDPVQPQHTASTVPLPPELGGPGYAEPAPLEYQQPVVPAAYSTPTTLAYTNTYALISIVLAFLAPIAGIVFGHLALGQIKRNGDAGRGLALTGLIVGYAYFVMIAIIVILYIGVIALMFGAMGAAFSGDFSSGYDYS